MIRKVEEAHPTYLYRMLIDESELDKEKVAIIINETVLNSMIRVYHNNHHGLLDHEKEFLLGLETLREEVFRKEGEVN